MYGKLFESLYSGSMVGKGSVVFAVWPYVIAHAKPPGFVELNPIILATIIGETVADIESAIGLLCQPDEKSRSKEDDGRRLVREGEFMFRVVNFERYQEIRNGEDRKAYMRDYMQEYRSKGESEPVNSRKHSVNSREHSVNSRELVLAPLAHSDSDSDSDSDSKTNTLPAEVVFWNANCGKLPKVASCSSGRMAKLKQRRRDKFWATNYETAVKRIAQSEFCCGKNQRGWLATFDFMLQPDSVAKTMEGKYETRTKPQENCI